MLIEETHTQLLPATTMDHTPVPSSINTTDSEKGNVKPVAEAPTGSTVTGIPWLLVCVSLYISIFIYGLDTTIAADVQGSVVDPVGHVE